MTNTISRFVDGLKKRLSEDKANFVYHDSMMGSTEGGFYETDEFDFDQLLKEIDKFAAEFKDCN